MQYLGTAQCKLGKAQKLLGKEALVFYFRKKASNHYGGYY